MEEKKIEPKTAKKLVLNKETIRILTEREMQTVDGGYSPPSKNPCSPSSPPATCPPP